MNQDKKRLVLKLILCIAIIGIGVSGWGIYSTLKQYNKSIKAYNELEKYVKIDNPVIVEEIKEEEILDVTEVEDVSLIDVDFDMDFASLKAINPDIIGWIYYEPVELSYPVVMDRGDDFYEHYSFDLEKNVAGAIFMDYACKPNLEGFNSIIYGHNMRNGTMFGSLKKLLADTSIINENPYFYIFTDKYAYMYKIVCAYYTPAGSQTYDLKLEYSMEDKEKYIDYMESVALYKEDEFFNTPIDENVRIATLSTCHGLNSGNRTVIHGVLIAQEER